MTDLTALLPDEFIIQILILLTPLLEAGDAALRALPPHPTEVTRLQLINHVVHALFAQAILVEELTAEDAEAAAWVRVNA